MDSQERGGKGQQRLWTAARVLRKSAGQGDETFDGSSDLGAQDRGDHPDRLEERSALRRRTPETASGLSVSDPIRFLLGDHGRDDIVGFLRRTDSRESIHRLPRPGVPTGTESLGKLYAPSHDRRKL